MDDGGSVKNKKNALVVSLCYRRQDNYVKCEGTLKDVDIIKGLLLNKLGFNEDEIKVLTEAEATKTNFVKAINDMITENAKTNFVYFVGHGYSVENMNKGDNDRETNDSGIVLWDGYMVDDDLCKLVAGFGKKTKNLFMFAECYSGGVLDLKFAFDIDASDESCERMTCERMKKIRDVKSRSVLISAVDSSQVSWVTEQGTYFARGLEKVMNASEFGRGDFLTFGDLMQELEDYCPKQHSSLSASFMLDRDDLLYCSRNFTWTKT